MRIAIIFGIFRIFGPNGVVLGFSGIFTDFLSSGVLAVFLDIYTDFEQSAVLVVIPGILRDERFTDIGPSDFLTVFPIFDRRF